jgi:hypothetical protein
VVPLPFFDLRWQDIPDIFIVAFIIYRVLLLLVGTRAMQLIRGVMIIGLIGALANVLELRSLSWIIGKLLSAFIIVIPILFQPELRHMLEELGKGHLWKVDKNEEMVDIKADNLTKAMLYCNILTFMSEVASSTFRREAETFARASSQVSSRAKPGCRTTSPMLSWLHLSSSLIRACSLFSLIGPFPPRFIR